MAIRSSRARPSKAINLIGTKQVLHRNNLTCHLSSTVKQAPTPDPASPPHSLIRSHADTSLVLDVSQNLGRCPSAVDSSGYELRAKKTKAVVHKARQVPSVKKLIGKGVLGV